MEIQLTKIAIGMLTVVLISTGIFLFIGSGVQTYSSTLKPGFDNSSFVRINSAYTNVQDSLNSTKTQLISTTGGGNVVTDILGFVFNKGYQAVSFGVNIVYAQNVLIDEGIKSVPMGSYGSVVKNILGIMLTVIVTFGLLLAFIIKSGRE